MKKLFTFIILTIGFTVSAQIGINNQNPDASAALDITSTTGGLLPPRMTNAQRDAISAPATGLMVYVTDLNGGSIMIYNGTNWSVLSTTSTLPDAPIIGTATAGVAQASIAFTAPTSNGGSIITSYTATSNPGSISGSLSQSGSGNITVTGLTNNTAYTFTVTATNQNGTSVASASSNSLTPTAPPEVGDFYQGGVVFYIYQSGDTGYVDNETHGLIVSVSDVSTATWGPIADVATSNAIGTGLANTNLMSSQVGSGAANACLNYSAGGYSDWFLPSKDELQLIVNNKSIINSVSASNGGSSFTSEIIGLLHNRAIGMLILGGLVVVQLKVEPINIQLESIPEQYVLFSYLIIYQLIYTVLAVNYQGLVPELINALKEQQSKIDELKQMFKECL